MELFPQAPPPGGWKPYQAPAAPPSKSLRQIVEEENARQPKPKSLAVMVPRCNCGRLFPHTGVPCLGAMPPAAPAPMVRKEKPAPKIPAPRGRKKNPPKDPALCAHAGCMNPRRQHAYGRVVAFCDQHCEELAAYHRRRYACMRAANPLPPRKPREEKDETLCITTGCTRPRKVWEGGHTNQRCIECSDLISARARARREALKPIETPEEVERKDRLFRAKIQRVLDRMVESGEIAIVGRQEGEPIYQVVHLASA